MANEEKTVAPVLYKSIKKGEQKAYGVTDTAAEWHRWRRREIMRRHPEIKSLFRNSCDEALNVFLLLLMWTVQTTIALMPISFWTRLLLAWTVGAMCCHGIQALIHELCHGIGRQGRLSFINLGERLRLGFYVARFASTCCNFPWAMYYEQYHFRHHAYTGGAKDADGLILFKWWHSPPAFSFGLFGRSLAVDFKSTRRGRILWSAIFSASIYPLFLFRKRTLDVAHPMSMHYEGAIALYFSLIFWLGGGLPGVLYLFLSAMFSLGAFCHPYWVFWLIQHQCAVDAIDKGEELWQPTVSYYGSDLANWLNFGELYHVEHHDFPRIPFNKIHRCRKIAPEFYNHLYAAPSIFGAIKDMINRDNDSWLQAKGDFAGRERHIDSLRMYYTRKRLESEMYMRRRTNNYRQ